MQENSVHTRGESGLLLSVYQNLLYDFLDKIIFLVDDVALIATVQDIRKIHRIFFCDFLVLFQKLQGVPAIVFHLRVPPF